MSELREKDISNVVVQCRKYFIISCRGLCLNYLKKISQTWWSSVGSILQYKLQSWFVFLIDIFLSLDRSDKHG